MLLSFARVSSYTGGIRCERASALLKYKMSHDPSVQDLNIQGVYQLQGGILKYFEECGEKHYEGDCFVFDKRVALNPKLIATAAAQCFACRMPVTPEEQQSDLYKIAEYCPACYSKNKPIFKNG